MKAYVIKTQDGYFGWQWRDDNPLNGAILFPIKAQALKNAVEGEIVEEVEIKLRTGVKNEE